MNETTFNASYCSQNLKTTQQSWINSTPTTQLLLLIATSNTIKKPQRNKIQITSRSSWSIRTGNRENETDFANLFSALRRLRKYKKQQQQQYTNSSIILTLFHRVVDVTFVAAVVVVVVGDGDGAVAAAVDVILNIKKIPKKKQKNFFVRLCGAVSILFGATFVEINRICSYLFLSTFDCATAFMLINV